MAKKDNETEQETRERTYKEFKKQRPEKNPKGDKGKGNR